MHKKNHIEIIADPNDKGKRIDSFLSGQDIGLSRSRIQKLIKSGNIKVNGSEDITKSYIIEGTEKFAISNIDSFDDETKYCPQDIDIKIIFEDDYMIAVSKPPGMVVHPAPGNKSGTLLNAVLFHNDKVDSVKNVRSGIVHRLDKDTSGIILIAKDFQSHESLSRLFRERKIRKTYIALVLGSFKEKTGLIDIPISRSKKNRKMMDVAADGRKSETEFRVLKNFNSCSLIEVYPKTGRTHQIRVHLSHIGHPLIGDKTYGNKETEMIAESIGIRRHFLHASGINFIHPFTGVQIDIRDELPEDLKNSIESIKLYGKQ
ncbi:MAG TPA: RluA family pseudouridine synthase [Actinobacteria bacterium]|nr:RluA family pseudouridine synthase [Actinomycetota bacterium]